jgi:hypothetical protein
MHAALSQTLTQILEDNSNPDGVTLNELLERTKGRGLYLVIILLSLPFVVPVAIPGVSTVFGLAVGLLSLRLAFGQTPRLPKFMGDRRLSPSFQKKMLTGSVKFLRFVEKLVKPRHTAWMTTRPARFANAMVMAVMAVFLSLPFPSPPFFFTNSLPCYAIILIAVSMMEEDGMTIWIAYAVALGTVIYLAAIIGVVEEVISRTYRVIQHWLQR